MQYWLLATNIKSGEKHWFSLGTAPVQVGRPAADDGPNKLAIEDDPSLSRHHFTLQLEDTVVHIQKDQARNPIYLNGQPHDDFWVGAGQCFTSGTTRFELSTTGPGAESPTRAFTLSSPEQLTTREKDAGRCMNALLGLQPLLSGMKEPRTLFEDLLQLLTEVVPGASDFLAVEVRPDHDMEILAAQGRGGIVPSRTLVQQALDGREPVVYFWDDSTRGAAAGPTAMVGVTWALAAPIIPGDGTMFALYAVGREAMAGVGSRDDSPGEMDRAVVALVAEVVAQFIEGRRAHLLEIACQYEHEQRKLSDNLRDLVLSLTSTLNLTEVLDRLLESLSRVVPTDRSLALMRQGDFLCPVTSRGFADPEPIRQVRLPRGHELVGELGRSRLPKLCSGASYFEAMALAADWMAVPLISGNDIAGIVFMGRGAGGSAFEPFDQDMADIAAIFAGQAGIAIQNAGLYQHMRRLATIDELTLAFNRRHFFEMAAHAFNHGRGQGYPVSAIAFDVDHFKKFNDTHGHAVGDEVLRHVAERARTCLRTGDVFGRCGGEEFAVIFYGAEEATATVAERIRHTVGGQPIASTAGPLQVTISVGTATLTPDVTTLPALLKRADDALYASKSGGRNRVLPYSALLAQATEHA